MPTTPQQTQIQTQLPGSELNAKAVKKILKTRDWDGRSVGEVLNQIALIEDDNQTKGDDFERLAQIALPLIKPLEIESVIKPRDKDLGVDLIATTTSGSRVAIQCKFYTTRNITFKDIGHFSGAAFLKDAEQVWLLCGARGLAHEARTYTDKMGMKIVDMRVYAETLLAFKPPPPRKPLPLQQKAIDDVVEGFASGAERGKMIMACGTGKTFTALRIAEQIQPQQANLLFIAPSIALVAQARAEWLNHSTRKLRTLVICSDAGAGRDEDIKPNEIAARVTTDPAQIAEHLATEIASNEARVTFCTYQSLDKLLDAQTDHRAAKFDLAIIDEAHRTTGVLDEKNPGFLLIHDSAKIQADKRLYMTATPRIYKESKSKRNPDAVVVDMNDATRYGQQFHRLTFKDAVDAGVLCDYHVVAVSIAEGMLKPQLRDSLLALNEEGAKGRAADDQAILALFAISLAINGFIKGKNAPPVIERTIAYANNIRRSKWLKNALELPEMKAWTTRNRRKEDAAATRSFTIHARHLDGTSNVVERNRVLRELSDQSGRETPRLVTNAKLFTEGVDVPALNAIAFLDPRDSKVDTVQAVGRVMRRDPNNPDKVYGYIIVPVILPEGKDLIATLEQEKSRFNSLGNVLRALQSHDERLYTKLNEHLTVTRTKVPPSGSNSELEIQEELLTDDAKQAIYAKIAANTGLARPGKQIADAITQAIEFAAAIFAQEGVTRIIADTIGTPSDNQKETCKTAALLIVNACIMHKRLEETGNLGGLTRIEAANRTHSPISVLVAAWDTILHKDYAPIFQDAHALLTRLPETQTLRGAIARLAECAINEATTLNELGFDHAGPLYHRVLGTAQSDGAFYTKNLSAYLLAGLAFDHNFTDWKNPEKVAALKIADPACGTGTLLMAALKAIKDQAAKAQNLSEAEAERLHKHLVENAIYGFDINKYSIQLAACNLTIGAPNTDYKRMNLHTLQHGPVATDGVAERDLPEHVRHGALEMLLGQIPTKQSTLLVQDEQGVYGSNVERKVEEVAIPKNLDAVIYNPPFTDTHLQSGKYTDTIAQAMTDRLWQIRGHLAKNDPEALKSIAKRSIRPYFTPLVNQLLSPDKGVMAEIIPTTSCIAANGLEERKYIANRYHIEMVVTCHDPKHVNFSENTDIHESMVIAHRSEQKTKPTRFIQLAQYPENIKAAEELVAAIQNGESGDLFTEILWERDKVASGDWTPLQWMNPRLATTADEIDFLPNLIRAGEICDLADTDVACILNFDYASSKNGNMFCTISADIMQTISANPESFATAKKGKETRANNLWEKSSHFLLASRIRTTNSKLVAIYSEKPSLGRAFNPVGNVDKNAAKAYAAFMNSSFGVIQMLHRRSKILTYSRNVASQLKTLRLPDPTADLSPLLAAFEKVKHTPLLRLAQCHQDEARKTLDHAAAKVVGVDPKTTDQWREWLSQEPTINNKKWGSG